jgi:hypothetical protein
LQILKIPKRREGEKLLKYDMEWLAILKQTHSLLSTSRKIAPMPRRINPIAAETVQDVEKSIIESLGSDVIPEIKAREIVMDSTYAPEGNEQTDQMLKMLNLDHIWTVPARASTSSAMINGQDNGYDMTSNVVAAADANEIDIDDL